MNYQALESRPRQPEAGWPEDPELFNGPTGVAPQLAAPVAYPETDYEAGMTKEWPSDNLPRFGGSRPTKPLDPDLAKTWPAGTCYFCHLNVKKGKEGYSILPSLGGKVYCHKVCGAKARKIRLAQQIFAQKQAKLEVQPEPRPLKFKAAARQVSSQPEAPPLRAAAYLPLKKRMAAALERDNSEEQVEKKASLWNRDRADRAGGTDLPPKKMAKIKEFSIAEDAADEEAARMLEGLAGLAEAASSEQDEAMAFNSKDEDEYGEMEVGASVMRRTCGSLAEAEALACLQEMSTMPRPELEGAVSRMRRSPTVEAAVAESLAALANLSHDDIEAEAQDDLQQDTADGDAKQVPRRTLNNARIDQVTNELAASLQDVRNIALGAGLGSSALSVLPQKLEPTADDEGGTEAACVASPETSGDGQYSRSCGVRSKRKPGAKWGSIADLLKKDEDSPPAEMEQLGPVVDAPPPHPDYVVQDGGTVQQPPKGPRESSPTPRPLKVANLRGSTDSAGDDDPSLGQVKPEASTSSESPTVSKPMPMASKSTPSKPSISIPSQVRLLPTRQSPRMIAAILTPPAKQEPADAGVKLQHPSARAASVIPSADGLAAKASTKRPAGSDSPSKAPQGIKVADKPEVKLPAASGHGKQHMASESAEEHLPSFKLKKAGMSSAPKPPAVHDSANDSKGAAEPSWAVRSKSQQAKAEENPGSNNEPSSKPSSKHQSSIWKVVLSARARLASESAKQHQETTRLEVPFGGGIQGFSPASFSSPRLAAAALIKQQQEEQKQQQQQQQAETASRDEQKQQRREESVAETADISKGSQPIHSTSSNIPDSNLNLNQCRARLKSWRERAFQAEKDLAAQHRLLTAAEKRVQVLELQVEKLTRNANTNANNNKRPVVGNGAGSSTPLKSVADRQAKDLAELALAAQQTLECSGYPKLLRKFLRGTMEGNITPSQESLWWNLVNDTCTNLLRPHSNKFEFSRKTKECLYSIFHAPSGRAAYNLLRGEGGVGSSTWDVEGAQYNIPLPSTRTLHQFSKENPEAAEVLAAAGAAAATGP